MFHTLTPHWSRRSSTPSNIQRRLSPEGLHRADENYYPQFPSGGKFLPLGAAWPR